MAVDDALTDDAPEEVPAVTVADLRRFSETAEDLADPKVMEQAWS